MANTDRYFKVFPTRLRELMESHNTSQLALSLAIGISRQMISLYCSGANEPTMDKLAGIARYFNVSTDYLLGITDVPTIIEQREALQAAHEITGLDYEALQRLNSNELRQYAHLLSAILESDKLESALEVLESVLDYKRMSKAMDNVLFGDDDIAAVKHIIDSGKIRSEAWKLGMYTISRETARNMLVEAAKGAFANLIPEAVARLEEMLDNAKQSKDGEFNG